MPLNPGSAGVLCVPADVASSPGVSPCPYTAFASGAGVAGTGFAGVVGP